MNKNLYNRISGYRLALNGKDFSIDDSGDDPDHHILKQDGSVLHEKSPDEFEKAGSFSTYSVRAGEMMNAGLDPLDTADGIDGPLSEIVNRVYEPGDGSSFRESCEPDACGDILIVDWLELDESHRGFGLGLAVLYTMMEIMGFGHRLMILSLGSEDDSMDRLSSRLSDLGISAPLPASKKPSLRRLSSYFGKMGFEDLPDDDFGSRTFPIRLMKLDLELRRDSLSKVLGSLPLHIAGDVMDS